MKVGEIVIAKAKLTNSSGRIVRASRGERLKVVSLPPLFGFVVVKGSHGEFATTEDNLRPLTKRERQAKEQK